MDSKINASFVERLEKRNEVQKAIRAFKNFIEFVPKELLSELKENILTIEKMLEEEMEK